MLMHLGKRYGIWIALSCAILTLGLWKTKEPKISLGETVHTLLPMYEQFHEILSLSTQKHYEEALQKALTLKASLHTVNHPYLYLTTLYHIGILHQTLGHTLEERQTWEELTNSSLPAYAEFATSLAYNDLTIVDYMKERIDALNKDMPIDIR